MRTEDFRPASPDGFATKLLSDALREPGFAVELVNWYLGVFNAKGTDEWGERWTPETAHRKLIGDTAGEHERTLVTTWRLNGRLVGACLVFVDQADRVLRLSDLPSGSQSPERLADCRRNLDWLIGLGPTVAQYREIGILKEFRRGWEPVMHLMLDPGSTSMDLWDAKYVLYWTSRKRRMYPIMCGLDNRIVYDFRDREANLLMGEYAAEMRRRLSLPAEHCRAMIAERLEQTGALAGWRGGWAGSVFRAVSHLESVSEKVADRLRRLKRTE
jgi:hypothetical protein